MNKIFYNKLVRDEKKNHILERCGVALLRFRTDGSGEKNQIEQAPRAAR